MWNMEHNIPGLVLGRRVFRPAIEEGPHVPLPGSLSHGQLWVGKLWSTGYLPQGLPALKRTSVK